jgi:hypothetical protein
LKTISYMLRFFNPYVKNLRVGAIEPSEPRRIAVTVHLLHADPAPQHNSKRTLCKWKKTLSTRQTFCFLISEYVLLNIIDVIDKEIKVYLPTGRIEQAPVEQKSRW